MANEMEIASLPDSFSLGSFDHYFCDIKKLKHSIAVAVRFLSTEISKWEITYLTKKCSKFCFKNLSKRS